MVSVKFAASGYFRFILCFTTLALILSKKCPDSFVSLGDGCYYFSEDPLTWFDAFRACNDMSAHLVTVENENENDLIKDYLFGLNVNRSYWMGLTDDHQEGVFVWASKLTPLTFVDWGKDDPNNVNGENCVNWSCNEEFLWQDANCVDKHHFCYACQSPITLS